MGHFSSYGLNIEDLPIHALFVAGLERRQLRLSTQFSQRQSALNNEEC